MFTRAELEYKIKVCNAQMSLRIVVFSLALIIPTWLGAFIAQKLGFARAVEAAVRPAGIALLIAYAIGIFRIFNRTQRDHELVCPKCQRPLTFRAARVLKSGQCPGCGEKLIEPSLRE